MNRNIIDNLKIIEEYEKINGNIFKYNSYKKTINLIEMYDKEIKELRKKTKVKLLLDLQSLCLSQKKILLIRKS